MLTEVARGSLIDDLQNNVSYTYDGWSSSLNVWRAREHQEIDLPYVVVDFVSTSRKLFPSLGDYIGFIDDSYIVRGYCELELVNISCLANKYHNNREVRGREFVTTILERIRNRILGHWNSILAEYGASIERGIAMPIRDLTGYRGDVGTRKLEYDLDVYIRTDVRWDVKPDGEDIETARAESAFATLNNKNKINVIFE